MRIVLTDGRCQGHQMCAIAAPALFGADAMGNANVLVADDLTPEQEVVARKAAANCPERAIEIVE